MLDLAILGLLKERPMHGYELRKQLAAKLGFFWTVSFGSLYPTLKKLERAGVVRQVPLASTGARRRQPYAITEEGEQRFMQLLETGTGGAEDKFPLRVAFFGYLRPETRVYLLERRVRVLRDKLERGRAQLARPGWVQRDSWATSLLRHGLESTERDIAWLEGLIATEQRNLDPSREAPQAVDAASLHRTDQTPTSAPDHTADPPEALSPTGKEQG